MKTLIKPKKKVYKHGYTIERTNKGFLMQTGWGNFKYYYPKTKGYARILSEWWDGDIERLQE